LKELQNEDGESVTNALWWTRLGNVGDGRKLQQSEADHGVRAVERSAALPH
jgi:hypothetical protein